LISFTYKPIDWRNKPYYSAPADLFFIAGIVFHDAKHGVEGKTTALHESDLPRAL